MMSTVEEATEVLGAVLDKFSWIYEEDHPGRTIEVMPEVKRARAFVAGTGPGSAAEGTIHIWCDGWCHFNGTPRAVAGWSLAVFAGDAPNPFVQLGGQAVTPATNNAAEYEAVIAALTWARDQGCRAVIHTDSQLVVNQITDVWGCHKDHLIPLLLRACELRAETGAVLAWEPGVRMKEVLGH